MDLAVGAYAQDVAAPTTVVGGAALVGFTLRGDRWLSPAFLMGLARTSSVTLDANPGEVTLTWTVGRAEVCPVRWPPLGALALRPCLAGDFGVLSADAAGVPNGQSHVRPWATLGASALAEWEPLAPLFVEAEASLAAPLERDRFFIAHSPLVYRAPALVPAGTLALGVRFP